MTEKMLQQTDDQSSEDHGYDRKRLEALAESLIKKRDAAIIFRASSGVERRWREDQDVFDVLSKTSESGRSMIDYATGDAYPRGSTGPVRSMAVTSLLPGKCETAEGRFCDIMFPVDNRNWGLLVTPVPDLVKAMTDKRPVINTMTNQPEIGPEGHPVKPSDIAKSIMDSAKQSMEAMETEIDDQLTECSYNAECRKVVQTSVRLGTGVLKGPNVIKSIRKAWMPKSDGTRTVHVLKSVEEHKPESKWVDIWNCYPAPETGDDMRRCPYMWEYDEIRPRELGALRGIEGYFEDQIRAVLAEEPLRTTEVKWNKDNTAAKINRQNAMKGSYYEKWEYHGDVDREDLLALGFEFEEYYGQAISVCVVFVNDRPIKIQLNVLDTGDLPYDFFQWRKVAGSPWGIGVTRIGIWWERIINAGWRGMLDNARDSSGANVVVSSGLAPIDGKWEITGKKIWRAIEASIDDVTKAFGQFQIKSNQREMQALIEFALRFLDMETTLPMLFQGEQGKLPDTLGATNILVDSNNVALRTRVKIWDDQITSPHITRYYHWNMQYNDREDIKGDFNADARGTSVLMARDEQSKALVGVFKLKGDPDVDREVDWSKAVRQLCQSMRLDILKSDADKEKDEEAEKNQGQPADPKLQAAQIRAEGDLQKAQMIQQSGQQELEFKAQEAERQRQFEAKMKEMDLQMKMMEFAEVRGLELDKIKADLTKEASKQNLMRELADKKTAEMTKPPVEPAGRAPAGEAYQK